MELFSWKLENWMLERSQGSTRDHLDQRDRNDKIVSMKNRGNYEV